MLLTVPDGEIRSGGRRRRRAMRSSSATAPAPRPSSRSATARRSASIPLMTVPEGGTARRSTGAGCAVAGHRRPRRSTCARRRSPTRCGMRPVEVADEDRAAYHAAASIAANFLVTLEGAGGAARRHRRRAARAARPARPRRARELGRQRAPSRRSPAPSPAATRPRSPASAPRSRSARPTCSTPSMLSWPHRGYWRRHEDDPHRRRAPRAPRAAAQRHASASSRPWAPSTPATSR